MACMSGHQLNTVLVSVWTCVQPAPGSRKKRNRNHVTMDAWSGLYLDRVDIEHIVTESIAQCIYTYN